MLAITAYYALKICLMSKKLQKNFDHADTLLVAWASKLMWATGTKITVLNPCQVDLNPKIPTVVMTNHTSLFDIPISYCAFQHRLRMIGKKELGQVPFFGKAMRHTGHTLVDRSNPRQAVKGLAQAKQAIQDGQLMWISPEGTRSEDGELQAFKIGGFKLAQQSGAQIIPVYIDGAYDLLPKHSLMLNRHGPVNIHIGEAIEANAFDDLESLMNAVRNAMEAMR